MSLFSAAFELTTACPCRCETCGSSAGHARPRELDTGEWLVQIGALADLGCRRLCLLGGEPLRHPGWEEIAQGATATGLEVDLITCGLGLGGDEIRRIRDSGLVSITVSVDGTEAVHDRLRGVEGCFRQALRAIGDLDAAGMKVGVTSQVNVATLPTLGALAPEIQDAGALAWQLQLTMPSGRARRHTDLIIPPAGMVEALAIIRGLVARRGLRPYLTDNLGYLTRDDPVLRTPPTRPERVWLGCPAGLRALGVTSRGDVKGCLALPDDLVEGNVLREPLREIWEDSGRFSYNRSHDARSLGARCSECGYARLCRGGCTAVSMAVAGRPNQGSHCFRLQGVD